eukprot:7579499-Pyramimonas_sp.AAC.1
MGGGLNGRVEPYLQALEQLGVGAAGHDAVHAGNHLLIRRRGEDAGAACKPRPVARHHLTRTRPA